MIGYPTHRAMLAAALLSGVTGVALAELTNPAFERGNYTGWTVVSGTAWGSGPIDERVHPYIEAWEGRWYASTYPAGQAAVGVLRSETFTLNTPITFLIAGFSSWPGVQDPEHHNYVALKRASDDSVLTRVWAPQQHEMVVRVLSAPSAIGDDVYIEVIDDGTDTSYAWLAVDFFVQATSPPSGGSDAGLDHLVEADTWVATDALGRTLPTHATVGARRPNRFVGIFYLLWLGEHGSQGPFDINQIQQDLPYSPALYPTLDDYLDELENHYGPFGEYHHWGEPLFGYYASHDDYVIRKHMQMLSDAGVDALILDNTNGFTYTQNALRLMSICQEMRNEGSRCPQVTFLARENVVDNEQLSAAYNTIYQTGLFPDVWFRWEDKPLLLVYDADDPPSLNLSQKIQDFFTIRSCWGISGWPWFEDGYKKWLWIDLYPQGFGWDQNPFTAEETSASFGMHPTANIGRSYSNGVQPPYGSAPTEQGLHFTEQSNRALTMDPEFIALAGWNEWIAARWEIGSPELPITEHTFLSTSRHTGQSLFVDAYNHEYSRDAEPVKGGHADNYYYQMAHFIRRFKGAAPIPEATQPGCVAIDGVFNDWLAVEPVFRDHIGDQVRRNDHPGYFSAGPFTNLTGRNDIVVARCAVDTDQVYFYLQTSDGITPYSDTNWMWLLIDADSNHATGWEGYDFLVNRTGAAADSMPVEANVGDTWSWQSIGTATYAVAENELELSMPRNLMGISVSPVQFDFKWADNIDLAGDVLRFTTDGDCAPNDRFKYRYRNATTDYPAKIVLSDDILIREVYPGCSLATETLLVGNADDSSMTYYLSDDADWLTLSPESGNSSGEMDPVTIHYPGVAGLPLGLHTATVVITADQAYNSPRTATVQVQVRPFPPDLDNDGDVDQSDFGYMQTCFTQGVSLVTEGCEQADFDGNGRVETADLVTFLACMQGPDVPWNAACLD